MGSHAGWLLGRWLTACKPHCPWRLGTERSIIASRAPGLVHRSNRGAQYASNEYVKRLEAAEMVISLSGPAKLWENSYCESFLGTLKRE